MPLCQLYSLTAAFLSRPPMFLAWQTSWGLHCNFSFTTSCHALAELPCRRAVSDTHWLTSVSFQTLDANHLTLPLLHFARFQNCMDNSARFFYHLEMPSGSCLPQRQWPLSTLLDDPWETLSRALISTRSPLQHNSQFGISFQMNLYFHNVFDILFTHLFVCVCVCLNVCHSTQGEVREQLIGVPSLLQHMRPRN